MGRVVLGGGEGGVVLHTLETTDLDFDRPFPNQVTVGRQTTIQSWLIVL